MHGTHLAVVCVCVGETMTLRQQRQALTLKTRNSQSRPTTVVIGSRQAASNARRSQSEVLTGHLLVGAAPSHKRFLARTWRRLGRALSGLGWLAADPSAGPG
jgi:hypothetical protein